MNKLLLCFWLAVCAIFTSGAAVAAFDPVNDDTDIFLANPAITAERPNVLIILDNTANWNTAFTNEKSALVSVVNGLTESYNVGLMLFPETGHPNDNVDGGYMKFGVRQMTSANKTALSTIVNGLDILNDKGNNATTGLAMYEAYLYYAGKASLASFGKVKTDFTGNTAGNPLAASLSYNNDSPATRSGNALPANPTSSSLYNSPIADGCQKNFIIYISNGPANENASARSALSGYLAALTGSSPPNTISVSPNGQQGNWADEMAQYMANADVSAAKTGSQNVITYTVEVDPGSTGGGPDMTALLKSMANVGKGKYFAVSSGASGTAIVDALNKIFSEVQAVNSVFASTTLPVSVNVRGTNLNQVYIGVFRPDAVKAPRWLGNLKLFNLVLDTDGSIFLADQQGVKAEDISTGFISNTSTSFWTSGTLTPTNFWSFRSAEQNGVGGASDAPDGDLVEKGGVAQQIRHFYETSQAARKLYTCTTGCVPCTASGTAGSKTCTGGSALSDTPFDTSNTAIDAASLNLDTTAVSPLTGMRSVAVSALTDSKTVALSNALPGTTFAVSLLSNGGTTRTISNLTTAVPVSVTTLSGVAADTQTVTISTIDKVSGNFIVTYTGTLPSRFINNASISISGASVAAYNATWTMSSLNTTTKTFQINASGNPGNSTGGTAANTATVNSTTATATTAANIYTSGQAVTISGASPAAFNGTYNITVIDSTHFTYTIATAQGAATGTITASGNTATATATTSAAHGFTAGNSVVIYGANPSGYNGTVTIISVPTSTTFTYTVNPAVNPALTPNTATAVYVVRGAGTTVTATTATAHGFSDGQSITIQGSDIAGYNGSFNVSAVTANSFQYTTASALPANTSASVTAASSTSTQATVTATVTAHGFPNGASVSIGGTDTNFTGAYFITVLDANSFTFSTGSAKPAPTGSFTARLTSPIAYATATGHGFTTGNSVTVSGATTPTSPSPYNVTGTVTVLDADHFTYSIASAPGASTTTATAAINTTTAHATAVSHGFTNGQSVTIAGATPSVFNGTWSITLVDANNFTYTLPSAQGDASGSITAMAAGAGGADRSNIINWVRGMDNFEDENLDNSSTDIRASTHGDVLHSRPAVINYNRFGSDNDVYVFYGANDGIFHAIRGGMAADASDPNGPGQEAWGFIPKEFFGNLKRLRNNSPIISSFNKKPYFADGPIGSYVKDVNGDGKLVSGTDTVNLYIGMRRGGRFIYSLDVANPNDPKLRWSISNTTAGFGELGQTWSEPKVVEGIHGYTNPVLIFGAGYDPEVEDLNPSAITSSTATTVTTASGTFIRTMGRGIYVVDAITGEKIVSIGGGSSSGVDKVVSGMDYAIPSDVAVIRNLSGGATNRAYVGDTGGNVWRLDFGATYDPAAPGDWITVTKIASVGSTSSNANRRKFFFPPDAVSQSGFDAILIGSGDREHPFDTTLVNRMYMFKDRGTDAGPYTGTTTDILPPGSPDGVADYPVITDTAVPYGATNNWLYDATSNCLQQACTGTTILQEAAKLKDASGWFVTLGSGEKVIGNAVALAGTVFFNTNQPSSTAGGGSCGSNLGIARTYQVAVADATATGNLDPSNALLTLEDRSAIHAGGGYLPNPVHMVVTFPDAQGNLVPKEVVCEGPHCDQPPQTPLMTRYRKYWYKEIDQ